MNDKETQKLVLSAERFYTIQLNRAVINLKDAEARRDTRAVENIKRKIRVYNYSLELLQSEKERRGLVSTE